MLRRIVNPSVVCAVALMAAVGLFVYMLAHAADCAQRIRHDAHGRAGSPGRSRSRRRHRLAQHRQAAQPRAISRAASSCSISGPCAASTASTSLPDLAKLEAQYPGILVVIGVHSPKFDNEKKTESIRKAILRYDIKHPVINDADHKIWNAYGVNSWPTLGPHRPGRQLLRQASGEGNFEVLDSAHRQAGQGIPGRKLKETPHQLRARQGKGRSARSISPARSWPTPAPTACSSPTAPITVL